MIVETFQKWFRVSLTGLQINVDDDAFTSLEKHVVIVTESVNTSDKFAEAVRHLIGAPVFPFRATLWSPTKFPSPNG